MNYFSKEFTQIDKWEWNDFPTCDNVEKYSLARKIWKSSTALVRHRELDHQEIDGVVHWGSLFPKLRRDFEREGA